MPLYDYKCKGCIDVDEDGDEVPRHVETIVCSMKEISERRKPVCPECRTEMVRIMNQGVIGEDQKNKGIFPMTFHDWGSKPVTVQDRHEMKREMVKHDRYQIEPSDAARYKAKQMKKGRHFAVSQTKKPSKP